MAKVFDMGRGFNATAGTDLWSAKLISPEPNINATMAAQLMAEAANTLAMPGVLAQVNTSPQQQDPLVRKQHKRRVNLD